MQCPGCGFENESDNKYCNMCGMALPTQSNDIINPLEREPLELDLSLDLPNLEQEKQSESSNSANFDLDLSFSKNNDEQSNLKLDLNTNSQLDLNLNSSTMPEGFDLDLKLDTDQQQSTFNSFDFSSSSTENTEIQNHDLEPQSNFVSNIDLTESAPSSSLDLNLSPDSYSNLDLASINTSQSSNDTSILSSEDITIQNQEPIVNFEITNQRTEPSFTLDSENKSELIAEDFNTIPTQEAIDASDLSNINQISQDLQSSYETPESTDLNLENNQTTITETISFDFSAESETESIGISELEEALQESSLSPSQPIKPSTEILNKKVEESKSSTTTLKSSIEDDEEILSKFSIKPTQPIAPKETKFITIDKGSETKLHSPTEANIYTKIEQQQIVSQEDVEIDEDLTNLILGLEGKPLIKKGASTVTHSLEDEKKVNDQRTSFNDDVLEKNKNIELLEKSESNIDQDISLKEKSEQVEDYIEEFGQSQQEISPVVVKLSPQEQLSDIRNKIKNTQDPDLRYSLVIKLRELNLAETVKDFIELLSDEVKDIREVAAAQLGELGSPEAIKPLIQCLNTNDLSLKFIAARSLGNLKAEEAVPYLIKLLEEENDDLRYVAIEALGKIGVVTSLRAISTFLKSRNSDLRYIACEAVGNIKDPQAVNLVLPLLKDMDFEVRLKAIEALGKIGSNAAIDQLLVILAEDNERTKLATIQALGQIKNPAAVNALLDIYPSSSTEVKEKIIWALGEIGSEKAVEPLLKLSSNFTTKQTLLALEAFAKIKSPKACNFILSLLDKNDSLLKLKAIETLGEIKEKTTAGNLIPFLESPEPELKIAAAKALGKIANPIAIEPLVNRLTDSERDVRLYAIEALGNIKGAKAITPLIKSLSEQDEQIIEKAEWALGELEEVAVEPLCKALFTESNNVLLSIVKVLGKIGNIKAIFPLLKVLENASEMKIKQAIADSLINIDKMQTEINPISVVLKEGYAWAQYSIAQALASINDDRAFSLLIKIVRDTLSEKDIKKLAGIPDKRILECSTQILHLIKMNVAQLFAKVGNDKAVPIIMNYFAEGDINAKQWCVEALGGIQTESALDALIDILKRPEYQIPVDLLAKQLIASKSKKLVDKLILSASHPSDSVRSAVALVLGETKDPKALKTLAQLVKDKSDKVRSVAIQAIGKIGTAAAVQPAIEALKDSQESVRAKAAEVLGELKDNAAVEFLQKATADSSELVRQIAVKSLAALNDPRIPDILIKCLSDKSPKVRSITVEMLGTRKDKSAVPALIKTLEDSSEIVREKAAIALAQIGDTQAIMPLLARLDDPSPTVPLACSEAIVSFQTRAYPTLIEALKHPEDRLRRHACDLLIRIGDDSLAIKLLKLINDRNNFMRENIAKILGKVGSEKISDKVIDGLIFLLSDRTSSVRRTAAESLGIRKDIRAIVALKRAERDQSREVRIAANAALQEIIKAHKLA